MNRLNLIIKILEIIEWGEHGIFWYIDNKEEAAEYILNKLKKK